MGMPEDVKKRKLTEITNITTNVKTNNARTDIKKSDIYSKHIDDLERESNKHDNKENFNNDNNIDEDFEKGIFSKEIETCTYTGWDISSDADDETSMENNYSESTMVKELNDSDF